MTDHLADAIAIVGLSMRAPKAPGLAEFWRLLDEGRNALVDAVPEPHPAAAAHEHFVNVRGTLEDMDRFDAAFFGIRATEARQMDPQQRIFLECAWEAMESAGCLAQRADRRAGVFASAGHSTYLADHVGPSRPDARDAERLEMLIANDKDFLAARVAYKLDLKGPAVTVQAACSGSLAAIHLAAQSLLLGDCDLALAGGVSIDTRGETGYVFEPGFTFSPDGVVRSFDRHAQGTVPSAGAGVVVLKRLADAVRDGDAIHATLLGSAMSNDGAARVGMSSPTSDGVARAARDALAVAHVDPSDVGYIEAHGSGTPLGDRTELRGLLEAYPTPPRDGTRWIGSVKTNVGHLDVAAGVAGFIKAVLALHHERIPPSLNCRHPVEEAAGGAGGLRVVVEGQAWPRRLGRPRMAAVSSMGLGGHNVHAVLGEAPPRVALPAIAPGPRLLGWSARSDASLRAFERRLFDRLESDPTLDPALVGRMLLARRPTWGHRRAGVVDGASEHGSLRFAAEAVEGSSTDRARVIVRVDVDGDFRPVPEATMTGCRAFRESLAEGLSIVQAIAGARMSEAVARWIARGSPSPVAAIDGASSAERLALHAAGAVRTLAFARQFVAWGMTADGWSGRGAGEFVAAALEGLLTNEQALRLTLLFAGRADGDQRGAGSPAGPLRLALSEPAPSPRLLARLPRWERLLQAGADPTEVDEVTVDQVTVERTLHLLVAPGGARLDASANPLADDHAPLLRTLADLWVRGATIDWDRHHDDLPAASVILPPTAFQRESHWIPKSTPSVVEPASADTHVAAWVPHDPWHDEPSGANGPVLVTTYDARRRTFTIAGRPFPATDLQALEQALRHAAAHASRCVACFDGGGRTRTDLDEAAAAAEALRLLSLALVAAGSRELIVAAREAFIVRRSDSGHAIGQMLAACVVALDQQLPGLSCAFVDVGEAPDGERQALFARMPRQGTFALRDGRLHRRALVPTHLPAEPPPLLRNGDVYLVTGGNGQLGRVLCRHLAATFDATVIAIGRTVDESAEPELTPGRGRIVPLRVDASQASHMRAALARAGVDLASVGGVFHLAGVAGLDAIVDLEAPSQHAELRRQFEPRSLGILAIEELFPGPSAPFKVLFSSLATVFGGTGLYAYGASCALADAEVEALNRRGHGWTSIAWDFWRLPDGRDDVSSSPARRHALDADKALSLLDRALFEGQRAHLFCIDGDPGQRMREARAMKRDAASVQAPGATDATDADASLPRARASAEEIEPAMIDLWNRLLGADVRSDSNFFALGGDSMLAVRLSAEIRKTWHARVPLNEFVQYATPRMLSIVVADRMSARGAEPADVMPPAQSSAAPTPTSLHDLTPSLNALSVAVAQEVCRRVADAHDGHGHGAEGVQPERAMLHQYLQEFLEEAADTAPERPGATQALIEQLSRLDDIRSPSSGYGALVAAISQCGASLAAAMRRPAEDASIDPSHPSPSDIVFDSLPESIAAREAALELARSHLLRRGPSPLNVLWIGHAGEAALEPFARVVPPGSRWLVIEPVGSRTDPDTREWMMRRTGDVDDAPAATNDVVDRFDLIVCTYSLCGARSLERTLAGIAARLAPDGALIAMEIVVNAPWHLVALGGSPQWLRCEDFRAAEPGPHLSWPQWRQWLARAGFEGTPQPGNEALHQMAFIARRVAT